MICATAGLTARPCWWLANRRSRFALHRPGFGLDTTRS
jgi:hypothetical protein